jgi:hypothetical protein
MVTNRQRWTVLPIVAALAIGLAACGSDGGSATSTSTTEGSDYTIVPDAEVTAGLAAIQTLGRGLAATPDGDAGRTIVDRMYGRWFRFEGTIRAENRDLYLQMEDGLSGMKLGVEDGKPKRITSGLAEFIAGAEAYQAAHR